MHGETLKCFSSLTTEPC